MVITELFENKTNRKTIKFEDSYLDAPKEQKTLISKLDYLFAIGEIHNLSQDYTLVMSLRGRVLIFNDSSSISRSTNKIVMKFNFPAIYEGKDKIVIVLFLAKRNVISIHGHICDCYRYFNSISRKKIELILCSLKNNKEFILKLFEFSESDISVLIKPIEEMAYKFI